MASEKTKPARRKRVTSRRVLFAEKASKLLITVGGIGTILAVTLIFVFLVQVVVPLFLEASTDEPRSVVLAAEGEARDVLAIGTDENRHLGWVLRTDGRLELVKMANGESLQSTQLFPDGAPTSASFSSARSDVVFGFAEGTLRTGRIGFETAFLHVEPDELGDLERGAVREWEEGIVERTIEGQLRTTRLVVEVDRPLQTGREEAITLVDQAFTPRGLLVAITYAGGSTGVYEMRERENPMTGVIRRSLGAYTELPAPEDLSGQPSYLLISGLGQNVYLAWSDGTLVYYDILDREQPRIAARQDLVEADGVELTAMTFLLGRTTLVAGDGNGALSAWFPVRGEGNEGREALRLESVHDLPRGSSAVTSLGVSARSRLLLAGYATGEMALFHVTTGQRLASLSAAEGALTQVALAPREDSLLAWTGEGIVSCEVDQRHPEASWSSLFTPVWYEGYEEPKHVWQSSGGTDQFEPKLGLMPLIIGTLKATLYSMLFGAPLALLAAIFTSEYLHSRLKSTIKSIIELMASLPSVVLGFLAALVIAPFVRDMLPAILALFTAMPVAMLLGAYLWQLLPSTRAVAWSGWRRFAAITLMLPVGAGLALLLGPVLKHLLFAGDVEAWLDGQVGGSFGGWFYLLMPLSGVLVAVLISRVVTPRLSIMAVKHDWDRAKVGRVDLLKFLGGIVATLAVSGILSGVLSGAGLDTRGGVFGTYIQRNALIVGFVMGFAIIPIIYTLAEDALSEVPSHLREASLGAGATHWQTAVRVVVPTAMSGLFSAVMIGLGRAVGETMIVLMAVGNTPIMDMNIFSGFRTLSANIAVELPEAVRNSTHYRTLFLAALVLFAMTFILNTVAEAVRRHFRSKTHAL